MKSKPKGPQLRPLRIDEGIFQHEFGRDLDYHTGASDFSCYLDSDSGEVVWVFHEDEEFASTFGLSEEENAERRRLVSSHPDLFIEIPGFDHGQHHEILRAFLSSEWTDDEETRGKVQDAYDGSIGRWLEAVEEDVQSAFQDFSGREIERRAEEFLRQRGIEPQWR